MIQSILKAIPLIIYLVVHWIGNSLNYELGRINYQVNKSQKIFDIGELLIPSIDNQLLRLVNRAFTGLSILLAVVLFPANQLLEFVYMLVLLKIFWMGISYTTVFPPHENHIDEFYFSAFVLFLLVARSLSWAPGLLLSFIGILYAITIIALRQNYTSNIVFGAVIAGAIYGGFIRLRNQSFS